VYSSGYVQISVCPDQCMTRSVYVWRIACIAHCMLHTPWMLTRHFDMGTRLLRHTYASVGGVQCECQCVGAAQHLKLSIVNFVLSVA
jgi:hypothetical protein